MQTISCDVCKKKLDNSETNRDFFYYANHSICEPCRDNLEASIKPTIRTKEPFAVDWYNKLIGDSLDKAVQKGRI
ncbi:MAG: hypothetical protein LBI04_01245 [Treponema sp.]|jgi:hypothetical protein|nr:hypothetical protein [Treponema sp.]